MLNFKMVMKNWDAEDKKRKQGKRYVKDRL